MRSTFFSISENCSMLGRKILARRVPSGLLSRSFWTSTTATLSSASSSTTTTMPSATGPYGLRMVDYSKIGKPPAWPLPPHPPERKKGFHIIVFLPAAVFFAGAVYVFTHQDEKMYDYWKEVDKGNVPLDYDDDDDDDDDDDFDDDDDLDE